MLARLMPCAGSLVADGESRALVIVAVSIVMLWSVESQSIIALCVPFTVSRRTVTFQAFLLVLSEW